MKIYIPEHIPGENKGEEAILRGIYQGLKEQIPDIRISVFSFFPEIDRTIYGKDFNIVGGITFRPYPHKSILSRLFDISCLYIKHFCFMSLFRLLGRRCLCIFTGENWKALAESDIILVGHNGVFSDINLLFTLFVKGMGKKVAIFGCGFRRFRFKVTEKLAYFVLPLIDLIILREEHTFNYLKSLSPSHEKILLKPDPAFIMKPERAEFIDEMMRKENINYVNKPLIGMIVTIGLAYKRFRSGTFNDEKDRYENYIQFFAGMCKKIIDITNGTIVFIPHCIKSANWLTDDRVCARDIKAKMNEKKDAVILIENEYNAATLKEFIARFDFLVSMRLHAVIGAVTVGTPFIMIAIKEDGRAHDVVDKCIGRSDLLFDINNPKINEFFRFFETKWKAREEIKEYLRKRTEVIENECIEAFKLLSDLIKKSASH